jgi:hypothetical protein
MMDRLREQLEKLDRSLQKRLRADWQAIERRIECREGRAVAPAILWERRSR